MKLACASTAFDLRLESGDLTQLEWLDLCARELAADGVVCDVRHFPRRDSDYLAQVKKMAVDLGLVIAALNDEDFFGGDEAAMRDVLAVADALGAPIVTAPLELETATSWPAELERLGTATSLAKTMNITLAVRNRALTFGATSHDLKRVLKEADSAWLRFGLEYEAFDGASDPQTLIARTVLLWHTHRVGVIESESSPSIDAMLQDAKDFRGFLVLDAAGGNADRETMRNHVRTWRTILAEEVLGEAIGG
ncbi:MAG: sugar phosphate isomerase/epimerase family protein [Candidatus Baltobacteraceae bacterium]